MHISHVTHIYTVYTEKMTNCQLQNSVGNVISHRNWVCYPSVNIRRVQNRRYNDLVMTAVAARRFEMAKKYSILTGLTQFLKFCNALYQ